MFRIKLKKHSTREFDETIDFENENKAHYEYWQYMKKNYYFGSLSKVVDNKEENMASFCKSQFAKQ